MVDRSRAREGRAAPARGFLRRRPGPGNPGHNPPVPARRPLVLIAVSAVCFALMAFAAKLASARLPGDQIAFVRFALMLLPLLLPRVARRAFVAQRLDLLAYRGTFGGVAVLLYFLALAHIPVGIATLLNYMTWAYRWVTNVQAGVLSQLTVVTSMLLGVAFLGDRLTPVQVLGTALALCGVIGVAWVQATPRAVE